MKRILFTGLCFVLVALGFGQESKTTHLAGYVDLKKVFDIDLDQVETEVEISNPLLALVAKATESEDQEFSELLAGLKMIKVYTFSTDSQERIKVKEKIDILDRQMTADKWNRFLRLRDGQEFTNGYLKFEGNKIDGFTLLSLDEQETVLINIVGDLNIESLSKLSKTFNIPKLDSLEEKN